MNDSVSCIVLPSFPSSQLEELRSGWEAYIRRYRLGWRLLPVDTCSWSSQVRMLERERPFALTGMLGRAGDCVDWARRHNLWIVGYHAPSTSGNRVCTVRTDEEEVGRVAARHFHDMRFRHVAVIGRSRPKRSGVRFVRETAFMRHAEAMGLSVVLNSRRGEAAHGPRRPRSLSPEQAEQGLADWLRMQPKPLGVFFHQDRPAHRFRSFCRRHAFAIPRDIAIVGVDNDRYLCHQDDPPLSSVVIPWYGLGKEMALALHKAVSTGRAPSPVVVKPVRVHVRASTQRSDHGDALVSKAVRRMTRNLRQPPAVGTVARDLGVSEATLHRHFVAALGRSPGRYLMDERLRRAQALLLTSTEPVMRIGKQCGFASRVRFCQAFKAAYGCTPSRFRKSGGAA